MKENLVSLGEAGKLISLEKDSIKPGKTSHIKPGNVRKILLHKPIAIGHPVVERRFSNRARTEGIPLGYQKTTKIQKIDESNDGKFTIETETSIYKVVFDLK